MMKIKRRLSGNAGAPPTLGSGQLAWNSIDKTLYIGDGDNGSGTATSVVGIASGSFATQSYVDGKISSLVNGAGAALDTLSELANALGNDANFSTTISTQIAAKLNSTAVSSFMLPILGSVDAATVRNSLGAQAALGFTPVQQGGGTGQGTNKVYIGWANPNLLLQVDTTNYGTTWPINVSGNAATATNAASATNATNASQLASTTPSAFGLARLSDTNAAGARTGLGLGSASTLNVGTAANDIVQLDANGKLPAVDGSALTNLSGGYLPGDERTNNVLTSIAGWIPFDTVRRNLSAYPNLAVGGAISNKWDQTFTKATGANSQPATGSGSVDTLVNVWTLNGKVFVLLTDQSGSYNDAGTVSSDDGATWSLFSPNLTPINAAGYVGTNYVMVSAGAFAYSANGTAWTSTGAFAANYQCLGPGASGGSYFVIPMQYNLATPYGRVAYTTNGTTWSYASLPGYTSGAPVFLKCIAAGAGMFVAVGCLSGNSSSGAYGNMIHTSPSTAAPTTWTSRTVPTLIGYLAAVSFANNQFIATTNVPGEIITSPDGITWTQVSNVSGVPGNALIGAVNYGGVTIYFTGGQNGAWSYDLKAWNNTSSFGVFSQQGQWTVSSFPSSTSVGPNFASNGRMFYRDPSSKSVGYFVPFTVGVDPSAQFVLSPYNAHKFLKT